jgi:hypothetical protein
VFLSKIIREVEVESEDEDEDGGAVAARGSRTPPADDRVGGGDDDDGKVTAKPEWPVGLWAENDLNISEVQGVKMWDKEIWAGRL